MRYRHAVTLFVLVYVVFFAPVLFRAEVIFPHNNDIEVGAPIVPDPGHISNGKFADESSVFIPEINFLLNGSHKAWIGTWNPDTEFGRPAQMFGTSKAYLPALVLTFFTNDPFVFYTWSVLLTVFLSGLFMFLLMKDLDISPPASLVAASATAFGIYTIYWFTFNLFIAPFCWSLGLMWLSRRFIQRPSLVLALGLSFVTYSLFMTGYPQTILLNLYIVAGFVLVQLYRSKGTLRDKVIAVGMLGGAAFFGFIMTAPVYLDILETARRSARLKAGSDFFLKDFPRIGSFGEFLVFLNSVIDPFVFGNPIKEKYIFGFFWPALTPLYSALFILSFIKGQWRRLWTWQALVGLCLVATVFSGVYLFAVRHLGFNMSAIIPFIGIVIPSGIIIGFSADYLLVKDKGGAPLSKAAVFLSLAPLAILVAMYREKVTALLDMRYLALGLVMIIVFYVLSVIRSRAMKTWGLLALTLLTVFVYGRNIRLIRPEANIQTTSRFVKFVRAATGGGATRLAFIGFKNLIPPNQESLLRLKSIHTYDSLSSREYQRLVKKLSVKGTYTYGRHFDFITDGTTLERPEFTYTGIGLFISSIQLDNPGLSLLGQWRKYRFYRPAFPPIMAAQVKDFVEKDAGVVLDGRLEDHRLLPVRRLDRFTDYKTFSLTPLDVPSLLFISGQYHPRWEARTRGGTLRTVKVNDFYEGVIIPPGTREVVLEFRPWVLYMWVPEVIFPLFGAVLLVWYLFSRKKKGGTRPAGALES